MKDGDALKELYALQLQKNTGQTIDGKKSNSLKLEFNPIILYFFHFHFRPILFGIFILTENDKIAMQGRQLVLLRFLLSPGFSMTKGFLFIH